MIAESLFISSILLAGSMWMQVQPIDIHVYLSLHSYVGFSDKYGPRLDIIELH